MKIVLLILSIFISEAVNAYDYWKPPEYPGKDPYWHKYYTPDYPYQYYTPGGQYYYAQGHHSKDSEDSTEYPDLPHQYYTPGVHYRHAKGHYLKDSEGPSTEYPGYYYTGEGSEGHQGRKQKPESFSGPQDANQLVDDILQYAKGGQEDHNTVKLQDLKMQFQGKTPSGERIQIQLKLKQGQLSGIATQAQRSGESKIQKRGESRWSIEAPLQFEQLEVQYDKVGLETKPKKRVRPESLQGTLENVTATLNIEYNEEKRESTYQGLQVQRAQQSQYTLQGAEQEQKQYPDIEKEADQQIQEAAARALQQHMKQIIRQYNKSRM